MKYLITPYFIGLLFIWISFSSCVSTGESSATGETGADLLRKEKINNEQIIHYWDNFDVTDTVALNNADVGEQAFVNFIARFPSNSDTIVKQAIYNLFAKTVQEPLSQQYFIKQFDHYLYNANSPMRNDAYYELVLEVLLQSNSLDEVDRYRFRERLKLVKKNKVSEKALDFEVELVNGEKTNLHNLQSPFTLLFFYEPGCSHCEEVIVQFQNTPALQNLISQHTLKVLAVYTIGDRTIWKEYQSHIPAAWVNGFDRDMQILSKALYDLKASPTIYLLDKDKKVILKDTDLPQLTLFFNENNITVLNELKNTL